MINPDGKFQVNDGGKYEIFGDIKKEDITTILHRVPLDEKKFDSRYIRELEE